MIDDVLTAVARIDPLGVYFVILGGFFFAFIPVWRGDDDSTWKDILTWGVAVYFTYYVLVNLNRFIGGEESALFHSVSSLIRWSLFVFTVMFTAGMIRGLRKWWFRRKNDRLP